MKSDQIRLDYEELAYEYASEQRVGPPAGVFLLDGAFHVAVHGTRTALRLAERGALLVADLLFDPAHAARAVAGGAPAPAPPRLRDVGAWTTAARRW